jgi:hypothetical protein
MPMVEKSHPTKDARLSKGKGRQYLFFSPWLRINGGRFFVSKNQGLYSEKLLAWGTISRPHALHVALAGRSHRLFVAMGVD